MRGLGVLEELCRAAASPRWGRPYELFSLLLRINASIYKKAQPDTAVLFFCFFQTKTRTSVNR